MGLTYVHIPTKKSKHDPQGQPLRSKDPVAHMVTLSLIKEARIYNGEKTASSISGAGKTGQLHVKE